MTSIDQLLSDFIDAWNAGRRPSVRDYLARAPEGSERDELAELIGVWLETAPAPVLDEATRADVRREAAVQRVFAAVGDDAGLWPQLVPRLRARAGLSIADVAERIVARFRLGDGHRERAADYLERMERGELEPTRVSRRLLDALGDLLGASGATLAEAATLGTGLRPAASGGTLFRADPGTGDWVAEDLEILSRAALTPAAPLDELDRLFTGGADA
jgi:transcriptional regulator with XRE-family HTH domain